MTSDPNQHPVSKGVIWQGSALQDLRSFPADIRQQAGFQIDRLQRGLEPVDWKPMGTVGPGVKELRFRDSAGIYRVMYVAKFDDVVYVLHAFQKKTEQTAKHDIDIAKARLKAITRKPK